MARRRLKASERKASIVEVAKRLFARGGYHGVSVDEIAREVGVSPAVLYQHYRSKETLYQEVLNETTWRHDGCRDGTFTGATDFANQLGRMTAEFVRDVLKDPDRVRIKLLSALDGSEAQDFLGGCWRHFTDGVRYAIAEVCEGDNAVDVGAAILMFRGMVRELVYARAVLGEEPEGAKTIDEEVRTLVSMYARALGLAGA